LFFSSLSQRRFWRVARVLKITLAANDGFVSILSQIVAVGTSKPTGGL
jgi:hypothetical protein